MNFFAIKPLVRNRITSILPAFVALAIFSIVSPLAACQATRAVSEDGFSAGRSLHLPVQQYANVIAWSPDSRMLAASDQRGHLIYVWDANTGQLLFSTPNSAGLRRGLSFTADGKYLLGTATDTHGKLAFTIWDAHAGKRLRDVSGPAESFIGSSNAEFIFADPDRKHVVVIFGGTGNFGVYEVGSWRLDTFVSEHLGLITSAAISPDGRILATGTYGGKVEFWHLPEGGKLREFIPHDLRQSPGKSLSHWSKLGDCLAGPNRCGRIFALAFRPDGQEIAIGSEVNSGIDTHQLCLWHVATGHLVRTFMTGRDQGIYSASYTPDGKYLATVSHPSIIQIWDLNAGVVVARFSQPVVAMAAFSPDGRKLAFAGAGGVTVVPVGHRSW